MIFSELENKINYKFKNLALLEEALTHPSVKRFSKTNFSYQRLEFLGDKALGLVIANYLIENFKEEDEGRISKMQSALVCKTSLVLIAKTIELGKFIIIAKNQEKDGGRESDNILENTMEALIGAIFLDSNLENTTKFIISFFSPLLLNINHKPQQDPKSALQEWFQKRYKTLPVYEFETLEKTFIAKLTIKGRQFVGEGVTKKEAEKIAAQNALNVFTQKE